MRNFKVTIMHCFLAVLIFFLIRMNVSEASENLDAAEIRLACAICSMGAYSDDESYLMRSMLTDRAWQIEKLSCKITIMHYLLDHW